jgi:hypothetical protein
LPLPRLRQQWAYFIYGRSGSNGASGGNSLIADWLKTVRDLVQVNEEIILERVGFCLPLRPLSGARPSLSPDMPLTAGATRLPALIHSKHIFRRGNL